MRSRSWTRTRRALSQRAASVRSTVLAAPIPPDLADQIRRAYRALGADVPVAVRSSATAEDLPFASFAGQQDTFLNVVGAEAVVAAVRGCWASLWTERAVSYRSANGIDHRTVRLAVVVQRMVDSEVAGVLFTANPVSGTRTESVIDASPGLGESVVSGSVNPDRFVVDSGSGRVLDRLVGAKETAVRSRPGGGTTTDVLTRSDVACLTDEQVARLAALGQEVQRLYDAPQDIEWALAADGTVWLTQARPITTLYPLVDPHRPGGPDDTRAFLCLTLAQGLTRPITPMGLSAFRLIATSLATAAGRPPADRLAGPHGFAAAGQRVFVDLTPILRNRRTARLARGVAGAMEARTQAVLDRLLADPRFAAIGRRLPVGPVARVLWRGKVPFRLLAAVLSPTRARHGIARIERRVRRRLVVPPDATATQRLDHVEHRLGTDTFLLMPSVFGYAAAGLALFAATRRLLRDLATPEELQTVLRSLPYNVTTEMDLALWALSERIKADHPSARVFGSRPVAELGVAFRAGELPAAAQTGVTAFLDRYGHRAVAEIDLGMPRWSDEPEHLLGVLTNYLRHGDDQPAPTRQFAAGAQRAEEMVTTLVARAAAHGRWRGRAVAFSLGRVRRLVGLRESPKFLLVLTLAALRAELQRVGEALVSAAAVSHRDDVFWLDLREARRGLAGEDLREVVLGRRADYARELRRRHVPRVLLSDGTEPETLAGPPGTEGGLRGSPASAGTVTARVRVVLDPVGAHLEPGEILVAPSTDPGWTPLFLTAGGLVMEMGGSNSHGAVVAREYGIPAVVGVPDATSTLVTGQTVTVDGAAGWVLPVEDPG